jgi:hypothetical protein
MLLPIAGQASPRRPTCAPFDWAPAELRFLTTEALADKLVRDLAALSGSRGFVFVVAPQVNASNGARLNVAPARPAWRRIGSTQFRERKNSELSAEAARATRFFVRMTGHERDLRKALF